MKERQRSGLEIGKKHKKLHERKEKGKKQNGRERSGLEIGKKHEQLQNEDSVVKGTNKNGPFSLFQDIPES